MWEADGIKAVKILHEHEAEVRHQTNAGWCVCLLARGHSGSTFSAAERVVGLL